MVDQRVAIGMPCHQAILDSALLPEVLDQKDRDHGKAEYDRQTQQAPGPAIGILLLIIPVIHAFSQAASQSRMQGRSGGIGPLLTQSRSQAPFGRSDRATLYTLLLAAYRAW
jgi:hypothetical protein